MKKEYIKEPWYGKSTWQLLITILLFPVPILALKFYFSEPKYVTRPNTKGMPETEIVGVYPKNYESITGGHVQQVLQKKPEKIKKMRIKNMGKFHGLEIKESESMYWPLLENAHIESLDLYGTHIEPEAWKWLGTLKNLDRNLKIELTNQKLDDPFYEGLNAAIGKSKIDNVNLFIAQLDVCKLSFLDKIDRISVFKPGKTEFPDEASLRIRDSLDSSVDPNQALDEYYEQTFDIHFSEKDVERMSKSIGKQQQIIAQLIEKRCKEKTK